MDFHHVVNARYATKKFDGKKLPQEKVDALLELIRLAPSSFNIQPWFVKIVTDDATKQALLSAAWNQHQITTCSHLLIFCARTDIAEQITKLEHLMKEKALSDSLSGYVALMRDFEKKMSAEQKLAWAQRQVYLALGNALNGAKSLGFDSCPMEGFDPIAVARILNLPVHIVPSALCPLGYAADTPHQKLRFSHAEVFSIS